MESASQDSTIGIFDYCQEWNLTICDVVSQVGLVMWSMD